MCVGRWSRGSRSRIESDAEASDSLHSISEGVRVFPVERPALLPRGPVRPPQSLGEAYIAAAQSLPIDHTSRRADTLTPGQQQARVRRRLTQCAVGVPSSVPATSPSAAVARLRVT